MKLLVSSALLVLCGVSAVYSLKCYSCRGTIGKCSLVRKRNTVSCWKNQACYELKMYDKGEVQLGCFREKRCEKVSKQCKSGTYTHSSNCSIKCCRKKLCNAYGKPCEAGLDIAIVLDKSLSVKHQNLKNAILNLLDLIKKSNPAPNADHFGLITFSKKPTLAFDFKDSTFYNKAALLNRINQEPIEMKRWSRIDMALEMANRTLFSSQGGHRPEKPSLMIVFTDGVQAPKGGEKFKEVVDKIRNDLEQKRVFVIVVSVGSPTNMHVLAQIAGSSSKVINGNALGSTILDEKKVLGVC